MIHWELMVADPERTKSFYARVFDWTFVPVGPEYPEYTLVQTGVEPNGGLMQRPPSVPHSALNSYFRVDDLDRTLRLAVEAGATVIVPRTEVTGIGWFAMFLDPEQIAIGVMQLR
jgi:hypothetical protein